MTGGRKHLGALLLLALAFAGLPGATAQPRPAADKIEPALRAQLTAGRADFVVHFTAQADFGPAEGLGWVERGSFVLQALKRTAARSQAAAWSYLEGRGLKFHTLLSSNALYVWGGDLRVAQDLAAEAEVSSIRAPRTYSTTVPRRGEEAVPNGLAWGVVDTGADRFWSTLGRQGEGIVVADISTGAQWDHPALIGSYRCPANPTDPACWYDPSNVCGGAVCDNDGLGTHTLGTAVGADDPGLTVQAGVAPAATWIACKGCETGTCSEFALSACFDWLLAPGGDPANRPHVLVAPWYGPACDDLFRAPFQVLRAAGVFPAVPIGDGGPGCGSIRSTGDYPETFAAAAHDAARTIAPFSGRGPSCYGDAPSTKPNISAPGVDICSAVPGGNWSCAYSGTTMAAAHAAGAVALLWSCSPGLVGQVDRTFQVLQDCAAPPPAGDCGGPAGGESNYTYGYGYLDVYAAGQRWCGAIGYLAGHVTDSGATPLAAAAVHAVRAAGVDYRATTDPTGYYTMPVRVGTYTVTAQAYGYFPAGATGVVVATDTVTTRDFTLTAAPVYSVAGQVADAAAGWPLYAHLAIHGDPLDPPVTGVWTNPVTGRYSVTLAGGTTYTLAAAAWSPGYTPAARTLAPLTAPLMVNLVLAANPESCAAPGYRRIGWAYFTALEADAGGFTVTGNVPWTWGGPQGGPGQAHSGVHSWNTSGYGNNQDGALLSLPLDLSVYAGQAVYLSWWQWLQTEANYDFATVEASRDGGATWQVVYGPASGDVDLAWAYHYAVLDPSYAVAGFRLRFHLTSDGSITAAGYYVDDVGVRPIPAPTVVYGQGFEANNGGYTVTGTTSWAWGGPSSGPGGAHSGLNAWATNLAGNYANDEDGYVQSPAIDLGAYAGQAVYLSWWQWLQTEVGYDFAGVEVSRDGGAIWVPAYGPASGSVDLDWRQHTVILDPAYAAAGFRLRFHLTSDSSGPAPGYYVDDVAVAVAPPVVSCRPAPGGLVVGNVYDANTLVGLNGAAVVADSGVMTATVATPGDPAVADGFYTLFLSPGERVLTATVDGRYGPGTATVTVVPSTTTGLNLALPAGFLSVTPAHLAITLPWSMSTTVSLTLANTGDLAAAWAVVEDSPWIASAPATGTLDPAASVPLAVTLDAGAPAITWTGTYSGQLFIQHDTPYAPLTIPVTLTVVVSPCLPLTGTALSWTPPEPTLGAVILFTGTAAGSLPVTFTWNYGDGSTGRGAHPTHTYAAGGDYTVELTATNPCSQQVVRRTISVVGWSVYIPLLFKDWSCPIWRVEIVDGGGDRNAGSYASLVLDASGQPHISYYDEILTSPKYAWSDGQSWHLTRVDSSTQVGWYTSCFSHLTKGQLKLPMCLFSRPHLPGTVYSKTRECAIRL